MARENQSHDRETLRHAPLRRCDPYQPASKPNGEFFSNGEVGFRTDIDRSMLFQDLLHPFVAPEPGLLNNQEIRKIHSRFQWAGYRAREDGTADAGLQPVTDPCPDVFERGQSVYVAT